MVPYKLLLGFYEKTSRLVLRFFLINKAPNKCLLYYNLWYVFRYLIVLCDCHCHASNLEVILLQKL